MTPLDHIVAIVGSKAALAAIISRHPSQVTRFVRYKYLPIEHNAALLAWAEDAGKLDEIKPHLHPHCPCCGWVLTETQ